MNTVAVETLASIFSITNGEFKILLTHKKNDPYKGYWILPGGILSKDQTLEENIEINMSTRIGLTGLTYEQCYCFSNIDRNPSKRQLAVSFVCITDNRTIEVKQQESVEELGWFSIDTLPKLGYDHEEIILKSIEFLKNKIVESTTLKNLYPSDFTLPEIQKMYELLFNVELDRRNFRKKFINSDLIEETGDKNTGANGRPAKLYRFKSKSSEKVLF